jgi:dTDP-4-dehydrorhamnose reductase
MVSLVGYTGFVGSNIYESDGSEIGAVYNSKNIDKAYGTSPELLVYAGLRAEKYLANNAPQKDMELIVQAEENIRKINPKKVVLISTIDVFKNPRNVDETSEIDTEGLCAYGYNRYQFELWVREHYPSALIVRLPGLFGKNIKKNFIYDFINIIPFMLTESKFNELVGKDISLKKYYEKQGNGFYKVSVADNEKELLKDKFRKLGFSALNFTDSRSRYQFYNLAHLWGDIKTALDADIALLHLATEPVSAGEVYEYLTGESFVNELDGVPTNYDYRTVYANLFGGQEGYISNKTVVLSDIGRFVNNDRISGKIEKQ